MEVLASKTGYDTEMIEDDMELETELGIDSIKRVEILSEVQSQLGVEAQDVAALSRTRTVGEVIAAMQAETESVWEERDSWPELFALGEAARSLLPQAPPFCILTAEFCFMRPQQDEG